MSRLSARIAFLIRATRGRDHLVRLVIVRSVLARLAKLGLRSPKLRGRIDYEIEQYHKFYRHISYPDWLGAYQQDDDAERGEEFKSNDLTVLIYPEQTSIVRLIRCLRSIERQTRPNIHLVALCGTMGTTFLVRVAAALAGVAKIDIVRRPADLQGRIHDSVALLKGAPILRADAIDVLNAALQKDKATQAVYADEDRAVGDQFGFPQFKPDFSPILGLQYDYVGNVSMFTRDFLRSKVLTDIAAGSIPSWIGDRSFARKTVIHLPRVLHSEQAKRRLTYQSGAAFDRALAAATAKHATKPFIAIIIPTKDREELLRSCIQSIDICTDYDGSRISIVIVDNGTTDSEACRLLDELAARQNLIVLRRPGPFNYSWLCNQGAAAATAEILIFMNNDIVIRDRDWLAKLVGAASLPSIGVVGCKLLYPTDKVQHAGVVLGVHGLAGHIGIGAGEVDGGYFDLAIHTRELSAVTGALIAVRSDVFRLAGGYDERLVVAFSDTALCLTCNGLGFQTLCLQSALAFHWESASRGDDNHDSDKMVRLLEECLQVLSTHASLKLDPFYNPNLSLVGAYELAHPPRYVARSQAAGRAPRVLMLSSTFQVGHGVGVVIEILARALQSLGCTVFIGAPVKPHELVWPKNQRIDVSDPNTAAQLAAQMDIDVVMAHTPPFFSTFRVLPVNIAGIAYDHGEPPPSLFPDAAARRLVNADKFMSMGYADRTLAISEVVRRANPISACEILPLGNTHLAQWEAHSTERRVRVRSGYGWSNQLVVLNVCRFTEAERAYKGVDFYINLRRALDLLHPDIAAMTRFVLAGKALRVDVDAVSAGGIDVIANPSDDQLVDLYHSADLYLNASRWEGYNLGIAQALAIGLPVCASDIPAHRAFGAPVFGSLSEAVEAVVRCYRDPSRGEGVQTRQPVLRDWSAPAQQLRGIIDDLVWNNEAQNADRLMG